MRNMLVLVLISGLTCLSLFAREPLQQTPTFSPTPPSTSVHSLFKDDTCAPPCWFGLIPGVSTASDILAMFEANRDLFYVNASLNYDTGTITEDFDALAKGDDVSFAWRQGWNGITFGGDSYIPMINGILSQMHIKMNDVVSLGETLTALGKPNYIGVELSLYVDLLILTYSDSSVVVHLESLPDECKVNTMLDNYVVGYVDYYLPSEFATFENSAKDNFVEVPEKVWNSWLSGAVTDKCEEAITALKEIERMRTPTTMPTPIHTATPEAAPQ